MYDEIHKIKISMNKYLLTLNQISFKLDYLTLKMWANLLQKKSIQFRIYIFDSDLVWRMQLMIIKG